MKLTPALPSPYQPPGPQERRVVAALSAVHPARTAGEQVQRHQVPAGQLESAERERLAARLPDAAQARRAISTYQQVAAADRRSGLRELLGFDAYA